MSAVKLFFNTTTDINIIILMRLRVLVQSCVQEPGGDGDGIAPDPFPRKPFNTRFHGSYSRVISVPLVIAQRSQPEICAEPQPPSHRDEERGPEPCPKSIITHHWQGIGPRLSRPNATIHGNNWSRSI